MTKALIKDLPRKSDAGTGNELKADELDTVAGGLITLGGVVTIGGIASRPTAGLTDE